MRSHGSRMRLRRHGFTLTELIVVVAMMSVIAAYALTNVLGRRPCDLLDRASTQLASDLAGARMRAVSECRNVQVKFTDGNRRYVVWSDRNTNGVADADESEEHLLTGDKVLGVWVTENPCTFSPRGFFRSTGKWNVWVSRVAVSGAGRRYVYVLGSGQVRWTKELWHGTVEEDHDE
jgi:prepilin-type N-terminal cleavage/methylation domain-containing protein